jgi:CubicO group peptidase (beta-lactamase class C family)
MAMKLAVMLCAVWIAVMPSFAQTRGLKPPRYESSGSAGALALAPTIPSQGAAALSSFLQETVARGDVPAAVVMVVGPGAVLYHEAFGKLNVARNVTMPRDAIFRIASMTKAITSFAALMLVDEGKLKLDDRVDTYLPAFRNREVFTTVDAAAGTYATRPATKPITIRHLMTHTSGMGYAWSQPPVALAQKKTGRLEPELPLLHEPGERWAYGASTRVLGDVVATVSKRSIDEVLRTRIFEPLGMNETGYDVPSAKHARVVTVHQRTNGKLVEQPNPASLAVMVRGDGGLYSTARDYSAFLQMLLNGGRAAGKRLLSEGFMRELTRNQIGNLVVEQQPVADTTRSRPYPLGAGQDKWSLGFQLAAPSSRAHQRSPGSYSWAGINNTYFWVDPARQIGVIVLMQVLPFYDESAIALLQGVEERVNMHIRTE